MYQEIFSRNFPQLHLEHIPSSLPTHVLFVGFRFYNGRGVGITII